MIVATSYKTEQRHFEYGIRKACHTYVIDQLIVLKVSGMEKVTVGLNAQSTAILSLTNQLHPQNRLFCLFFLKFCRKILKMQKMSTIQTERKVHILYKMGHKHNIFLSI